MYMETHSNTRMGVFLLEGLIVENIYVSMNFLLNYKKNYDYKLAEGSKNVMEEEKFSRIKEKKKNKILHVLL